MPAVENPKAGWMYNLLPDDLKTYISERCPYKIGDVLVITRTVHGRDGVLTDTRYSVVEDILPRFKKDKLNYDLQEAIDAGLVMVNEEEMRSPIPEFIISYRYNELLARKHWWKFWEKRETESRTSTIIVDWRGDYCDDRFYGHIYYKIRQITA